MPIAVTAAVTRAPGEPFTIESLELNDPLDEEILVRIAAVGLCHTDVKAREGGLPVPFPIVLGHEGSGIVERVGSRVKRLAPGDHVVLSADFCGTCVQCHRGRMAYCVEHHARNFLEKGPGQAEPFAHDGARVHGMFFGQSSFATYALVRENSAIKVRTDVPIEKLGPLGCGLQTGAGAILNVLRPEAGTSIAILGAGSVGLAALLATVLSGCTTIAAVDVFDSKLEHAKRLGATHGVRGDRGDVTAALRAIRPDGFDFVFDTTGHSKTIEAALEALAVRGTLGLVAGGKDTRLDLDLQHLFHRGLTIRGIIQGDSVPDTLIPRLVDLFAAGRFPIDQLITEYPLAEINTAVDDIHSGKTIKAVLTV